MDLLLAELLVLLKELPLDLVRVRLWEQKKVVRLDLLLGLHLVELSETLSELTME